jgi:hypothetical protein
MKGDWREEEKLRHLVGGHEPQPKKETAREIGAASAGKSMAELAAAAIADIESDKARRKYSTDDRPADVRIRRSRVGVVALGLLIVVGIFAWKRTLTPPPPPIPGDPIEVVAVLSPAARLSAALAPEWSAGAELGERERAIRIGALIVEMERAVSRDDSTAHEHSDAISALLAGVPEATEVAALFARVEDARLLTTRAALAPFAREAPTALGAWLQGARVAATAGDVGFFASRRSRESLRLLLLLPGVSPEVQAARERLDTVLRRRGRPDFGAAIGALEVLQRELAN